MKHIDILMQSNKHGHGYVTNSNRTFVDYSEFQSV